MSEPGCLACELTSGARTLPGGRVFATAHWVVEHCVGPLGVGTLLVKPFRHCVHLGALTAEEAGELGPLLARTAACVQALLAPSQVYACLWSHAGWTPGHVHFVVQPVAPELAARHTAPGPTLQSEQFLADEDLPAADVETFCQRARAWEGWRNAGGRAGPVTGPPHHLDLSVGDPRRSIPFYAAFFEALGYRRWTVAEPDWQGPDPKRATWATHPPGDAPFAVELRPARPELRERRYERYAPGPHHLAFHAASHEAVDRVHRAMVAVGATVLDPPAEYGGQPGYGDAYYAAFFADPDGVKLEVVCAPRLQP